MVIFSKEECEYIKSFYSKFDEIDGMGTHTLNNLQIKFRKGSDAKFAIINDESLREFLLEKLSIGSIVKIHPFVVNPLGMLPKII